MRDLAIDPGYAKSGDGCACAYGVDGVIRSVWFERPPWCERPSAKDLQLPRGSRVDRVIVEQPQQDGRTRGVPPEVVMRLSWDGALLGGLYAGRFLCYFVGVTPSDWKGSIAKPVHHGQLWKVLRQCEKDVLGGKETGDRIRAAKLAGARDRWSKPGGSYYPKSWLTHNLLDAACMIAAFNGRIPRP